MLATDRPGVLAEIGRATRLRFEELDCRKRLTSGGAEVRSSDRGLTDAKHAHDIEHDAPPGPGLAHTCRGLRGGMT
jgi:hypothetical protein